MGHVLAQLLPQARLRLHVAPEGDKGHQGLALERIGPPHHGCLGHLRVAHQRALHLGCADAVAGDVENVIDTADDPVITGVVPPAAVAGEIGGGNFAPIDVPVSPGVPPEAPRACPARAGG